MSTIINRSNHPVEVKKIHVRMWPLRSEIEAAIAKRIEEEGNSDDNPVDIEDIKNYYTKIYQTSSADGESEDKDGEEDEDTSGLDSSGNPLDDDAMAMMAALGGGGEDEGGEDGAEEAEAKEESEEKPSDESEEAAEGEEDDEAAALAAQMLADQGLAPEGDAADSAEEDDESAALAAAMLADQGIGTAPKESTADDKKEDEVKEKARPAFTRVKPGADKMVKGFVLLSDVNMDQVLVFTKENFIYGQDVVIEFLIPNAFTQIVEVRQSTNIGRNSKVISENKMEYRVLANFIFKFPNERSTLRDFLTSIEPEIPDPPKKLRKPEEDDDDDDFDDLGF